MFSRLATLTMLALPVFAVATPANVARWGSGGGGSGTTPPSNPTNACCDSTTSANSAEGEAALDLIGVAIGAITGAVGLTCSPITAGGVGSGTACSGTTVSCSNGVIGGVGIGCVPITL